MATPPGASTSATPDRKRKGVGVWAATFMATTTSNRPSGLTSGKKPVRTLCPAAAAMSLRLRAGSMPVASKPRAARQARWLPSLEAISSTRAPGFTQRASAAANQAK